jgi:hypothetical protein
LALYGVIEAATRAVAARASTPGAQTEDPPHKDELEQLSRQGVARFFGVASTAVTLGVLRKEVDGEDVGDGSAVVILGLTLIRYVFTGDAAAVAVFLKTARAAAVRASTPVDGASKEPSGFAVTRDVAKYAADLRASMQTMGQLSSLKTKSGHGYVTDFIVRKLCLGRLCSVTQRGAVDWDDVSIAALRQLSADAKEHLSTLPDGWSAAQVSSFICGRPDWPMLASMYMCLWKEVTDAADKGQRLDEMMNFARSSIPALAEAGRVCSERFGFNAHPYILMEQAGWSFVEPAVGAKRRRTQGGA